MERRETELKVCRGRACPTRFKGDGKPSPYQQVPEGEGSWGEGLENRRARC